MRLARAITIVTAALLAAAVLADGLQHLLGGERGLYAGVLAACLITVLPGLAARWRRAPRPVRPAGDTSVTKPRPVASLPPRAAA